MTRIGIDARMLLSIPMSAHAALFRQVLLRNATKHFSVEFFLYTDNAAHTLGDIQASNVQMRFVPKRITCASDFYWLNFILPDILANDLIAVYCSPFYKIPLRTRAKTVNMIHDLAFFSLPRKFLSGRQRSFGYRLVLKAFLKAHCGRASRTVTVSHYSARELRRYLGIDLDSVSVCHNAVDEAFFSCKRNPNNGNAVDPRDYCLFVGSPIPKKNIPKMLEVFSLVPPEFRTKYPLIMRTRFNQQLRSLVESCQLTDTVTCLDRHLSGAELADLIRNGSVCRWPKLWRRESPFLSHWRERWLKLQVMSVWI